MIVRFAFALLLLGASLASSAHAQTFPKPNNTRVVDAADIIPADREAVLDAKLKALEDNSKRQLVVATIPSLEGYDIADYGYRLGRAWGIGQKETNEGALLIVAPNERKVRIEVGYGLEPILTDALSSLIIGSKIVPRFKDKDYPGGIEAGVDAISAQLTLPPEEAQKIAAQAAKPESSVDIGNIIFWLGIFFFLILPIIGRLFYRKKWGRRLSGMPIIVWGGGGGSDWGGGGSSWDSGSFGGGFSGGGGSFGGGGASGDW